MRFDFDTPADRRGTDSAKWDIGENELPMWVADMDFKTAPCVELAVMERAAHGIFGYNTFPTAAWQRAYTDWWRIQHGFDMKKEWLAFVMGVIPAISSSIRKRWQGRHPDAELQLLLPPDRGERTGLSRGAHAALPG